MQNSEDSKTATTSTKPARRKPYAPPKLTSIKLRPEEAVLGQGSACRRAAGCGLLLLCRLLSLVAGAGPVLSLSSGPSGPCPRGDGGVQLWLLPCPAPGCWLCWRVDDGGGGGGDDGRAAAATGGGGGGDG